MFHSSSQKTHWLFQHRQQLTRQRAETNASFCRKVHRCLPYFYNYFILQYSEAAISRGEVVNRQKFKVYFLGKECQFLTPTEEESVCLYYMKKLFEFCNLFRPQVPRGVLVHSNNNYKSIIFEIISGNSWCLF